MNDDRIVDKIKRDKKCRRFYVQAIINGPIGPTGPTGPAAP